MNWSWADFNEWMPVIWPGFLVALSLSLIAIAITVVVAVPLAVMRMSARRPIAFLAEALIAVTRAIPLYVCLLWIYDGLALFLHIDMSPVTAGIATLVIQFAGFQAEAYRSGLLAVAKGQTEAASAVGLTRLQSFIYVVLPQALRVAIPPTMNNVVSMFKATTIFAVIGVVEATRLTQSVVTTTGRPIEFYTVLAVVYMAIAGGMTSAITAYERVTGLRRQPRLRGVRQDKHVAREAEQPTVFVR
jgi:polar amino acid transport system permease protein